MPKFIVVSGGVCSSLGKGVTASSIGAVLRAYGFRVTAIKVDPYINIDAGLMSPFEHGEVYVLDDGGEVDLDLGNYERNMDLHLGRDNNITTGKVYQQVIEKERKGIYLGKTVQMVPHVAEEITTWIERVAATPTDSSDIPPDVCIVELGGTVGDIESMIFLEALRMLRFKLRPEDFCLVHCSLVPIMSGQKTKPTQHTVKSLLSLGLQPDLIVCRCEEEVLEGTKLKIAQQCGVPTQRIISVHTVPNLFQIPILLDKEGILGLLTASLRLDRIDKTRRPPIAALSMADWARLSEIKEKSTEEVRVAVVAKYTEKDVLGKAYTGDTYLSVIKALDHAALQVERKLRVVWVDSQELECAETSPEFVGAVEKLQTSHAILVPGGFGDRGIEGKVRAAKWARENKKPFLGVCLGMQMAVVDYGRSVLGIPNATSEEFDPNPESKAFVHILKWMPEVTKDRMGANMVLGARKISLQEGSLASRLYGGLTAIMERQRHRYEVHPDYIARLEEEGLRFTGRDTSGQRMEMVELSAEQGHPFFLGTQCHPEFKSRPGSPAPPFLGLLMAARGEEYLRQGLAQCVKNGPIGRYRAPAE